MNTLPYIYNTQDTMGRSDQLLAVYRQGVLSLLRASGGSSTQCWAYFVHHQAGLSRIQ